MSLLGAMITPGWDRVTALSGRVQVSQVLFRSDGKFYHELDRHIGAAQVCHGEEHLPSKPHLWS